MKSFNIRICFDTTIEAETKEQAIKLVFKAADENGFDVCVDGCTEAGETTRVDLEELKEVQP